MADSARVIELTARLALAPHPEGGRYRETFRSPAITSIFFLLASGEISRWHRVLADEVWHFYEGDPLALWTIDPDGQTIVKTVLGADHRRVHVVPAGHWQAARALGAYSLVGCDVAPAFEFANFTMLADVPSDPVAWFVAAEPEAAALL